MTRPSEVEVSVIIPVRGASASLAVQLSVLAAQLDAPPFTSDELDRALRDVWATLAGWLPRYLAQPDQVTPMPQGTYPVCSGARSVCGAVSHAYPRCRSGPTSA